MPAGLAKAGGLWAQSGSGRPWRLGAGKTIRPPLPAWPLPSSRRGFHSPGQRQGSASGALPNHGNNRGRQARSSGRMQGVGECHGGDVAPTVFVRG